MTAIREALDNTTLVDHHCHGLMRSDLSRADFELLATESDWPEPAGQTIFDSPFGITVRAEVSPLLGLERHASAEDYWQARSTLGQQALGDLLMPKTGIDTLIIDSGFRSTNILNLDEMTAVSGATSYEIVRLESVAESIVTSSTAATFSEVFRTELTSRASSAIGFKSIMAYRFGLDFNPDQPTDQEVTQAAGEWLDEIERTGKVRLSHPVLLRFILWTAVGFGKPIQFHIGYGDSDINLHRCDPTQMTEFIRRTVDTGVQITLLHCYPFIREAGFLAQVYPHVWLDTGAILNYTGPSSVRLVRDSLELSPLSKVLFSSDAFGLPELYYCGTLVWRRGTADVLEQWLERDFIGQRDALRYVDMMARTNALRCYDL